MLIWQTVTCKGVVILVKREPGKGFARLSDGFEDAGIAGVYTEGLKDVQLQIADGAATTDCNRSPPLPRPL